MGNYFSVQTFHFFGLGSLSCSHNERMYIFSSL